MFLSKTQKQLKEAKKLLSQNQWQEALGAFESLQSASDIDQVELLSLINQAKDAIFNNQMSIAKEAINRGVFGCYPPATITPK